VQVHAAAGWLLCTGVKLRVIVLTGAGLRLLDTATESGSPEGMTILGLGCSDRLSCGSLGDEPCATVVWSLQKPPGAICEEINLNGAF